MIPLPNLLASFVDQKTGRIKAPWNFYLQQFTQAPPNILPITLTPTVFNYISVEPGVVAITGGTITSIRLIRGNVAIVITGQRLIPVSINDLVEVDYSVLPIMQFIPSYGQRTS